MKSSALLHADKLWFLYPSGCLEGFLASHWQGLCLLYHQARWSDRLLLFVKGWPCHCCPC